MNETNKNNQQASDTPVPPPAREGGASNKESNLRTEPRLRNIEELEQALSDPRTTVEVRSDGLSTVVTEEDRLHERIRQLESTPAHPAIVEALKEFCAVIEEYVGFGRLLIPIEDLREPYEQAQAALRQGEGGK